MSGLIGGLMVVVGVASVGVGIAWARMQLRRAGRIHRITMVLSDAGGWGLWFMEGFSGFTIVGRWLIATATALAWSLAGIGLIGLGIRLI